MGTGLASAVASEGEDYEEKSSYDGSQAAKLQLVKTIASFANTHGGILVLQNVTCQDKDLDSARLDDLVNRYVEPRIGSIVAERRLDGTWGLRVPRSPLRPHVMKSGETYHDEKSKLRSAFHQGQIYVQHSSKTQPAGGDDITRLINERVAALLSSLDNAFQKMSVDVGGSGNAIPVRIAMDAPVSISLGDINKSHPYTAKTLGKLIGRGQNWVASAAEKVGIKNDKNFCYKILAANGKPAMVRYSDLALEKLNLSS